MKIAYIVPSLKNLGPIIVVKDLTDVLVKMPGVTCTVFHFDNEIELPFNCETVHLLKWQQVADGQFDIIHTHMLRPDLFFARNKNKLGPVKSVSTMHNYMYADLKNTYGALVAFIAKKVWCYKLASFNKVACLSNDMVKYYANYINPQKLVCVYNGRNISNQSTKDVTESSQLKVIRQKYKVVGGIGHVTKRKGFSQLINAVGLSADLALVLIGDGPELQGLKLLAQKLNISDRCIFLGAKKNAVDYYKYFDVYGVTSYSEGFPLVLLEASANGMPVVCSDIPVLKEVFNSDEVYYYQLDNIPSLVQALYQALENSSSLSQMILKRYNTSYTAGVMADSYMNLYKVLLKNG